MSETQQAVIDLEQFATFLSCARNYYDQLRSDRRRVGAAGELQPMGTRYRRLCRAALLERLRTLLAGSSAEYEVQFTANGLCACADVIMRSDSDGRLLGLVRSGSWCKRSYVMAAAFTVLVAMECGVRFDRVVIYHPRRGYVRGERIDNGELLVRDDVTVTAAALTEQVKVVLRRMRSIADGSFDAPEQLEVCGRPGECGYCGSEAAGKPAIDDPRTLFLGARTGRDLVRNGTLSLCDLPAGIKLTRRQLIQIDAVRQRRPYVDHRLLSEFVAGLRYPLRFLDFEAFSAPLPPFAGTRVWEHVPFLYTLQTVMRPGGAVRQARFCGTVARDYRIRMVRRLLRDIGERGSVIVFGRDFEARMLQRLGSWVPQYAAALKSVGERLIDLSLPFREFWYYHHEQRGSLSMKTVLPLLAGIGYDDLAIRNGLEANVTFAAAVLGERPLLRAQRRALLSYCTRDSLGMMLMAEALMRLCHQSPSA
ncbi:MAG: DUF2779 domain-containing protein [Spirochaetaceae bacterium]|nr:MAG: DUF2779 domain-containing protein [Spirochaetaceae bacterium]